MPFRLGSNQIIVSDSNEFTIVPAPGQRVERCVRAITVEPINVAETANLVIQIAKGTSRYRLRRIVGSVSTELPSEDHVWNLVDEDESIVGALSATPLSDVHITAHWADQEPEE